MRRQKYHYLTFTQRLKIEMRINAGYKPCEIAEELGVHRSTIYRELKRGKYDRLNSDYTTSNKYSPDIAEARYRAGLAAKGAPLKIGNNYAIADFIEHKIREEHYSPAAICALLKTPECYNKFQMTFCRSTIYKYIDDGNIFATITNSDLPERWHKKREYKKLQPNKAPNGRSIEERPLEIMHRYELGHWEMDTVCGLKGSKARLLVLSERKTRKEIIIKIKNGLTSSVVRALDKIERKYGALFSKIFKSITVDNGVEFANYKGLEKSCLKKSKRTTIYYCHPYTACERGTNENINRMIRRWFPKGTNFDKITQREVQQVESWINNYPRQILGYKSANYVFVNELNMV